MEIKILKLGSLETNCYLLIKDNKVIVIDPADEVDKIIKEIGNKTLISILVTHHHFDHIGALEDLKNHYKVEVYDHTNLEEKTYDMEGFTFDVLYNPGHTDDSISFYFKDDNIMFVGDFIFKGSIGRTDLGGNMLDMKKSIDRIKKYSKITLYPGHGDKTTIDEEKENNYYFNM